MCVCVTSSQRVRDLSRTCARRAKRSRVHSRDLHSRGNAHLARPFVSRHRAGRYIIPGNRRGAFTNGISKAPSFCRRISVYLYVSASVCIIKKQSFSLFRSLRPSAFAARSQGRGKIAGPAERASTSDREQ